MSLAVRFIALTKVIILHNFLSDEQDNLAIQLIPWIIPPKAYKVKTTKLIRPTYSDAADAFIIVKQVGFLNRLLLLMGLS